MSRRRKPGFLAVLRFVLAFVNPRRNAFASAERRIAQIKLQGWKQLAVESRRRNQAALNRVAESSGSSGVFNS